MYFHLPNYIACCSILIMCVDYRLHYKRKLMGYNQQIQSTLTLSTEAATDVPICWPKVHSNLRGQFWRSPPWSPSYLIYPKTIKIHPKISKITLMSHSWRDEWKLTVDRGMPKTWNEFRCDSQQRYAPKDYCWIPCRLRCKENQRLTELCSRRLSLGSLLARRTGRLRKVEREAT